MILLHRLRGDALYLNPDLIESVEATPDTIITLVDGRRVIVSEPPPAVADRIVDFRASVLVAADDLRATGPTLRLLPADGEDG